MEDNTIKTGAAGEPNSNEGGEQKTTYTKDEVEKLLQAETDRRVSSALKKAEEKNQAKIREAEKLARMNESERYEYELNAREKAIEEKEKALSVAENTNQASKILNERGISLDLVELVVSDDAESMLRSINLLDKAFKASVKAEVERRLAGNTPKKNLPTDGTMTKDQFHKLSLTELAELKRTDPELYNSLRG